MTLADKSRPSPTLRLISGGLDLPTAQAPSRTEAPVHASPLLLNPTFWTDWAPILLLGLSALAAGPLSLLHALTR